MRTTAKELARWLEQHGGTWHVEGEPVLEKSLPLPTPASSLVDALRKRADREGELAVLAPETADGSDASSPARGASGASVAPLLAEGTAVTARDLAWAAHLIDGMRVFQLAWIGADGAAQDSWLLAEQGTASSRTGADDGSAARSIVAAYRAAVPGRDRETSRR